MPSKKIKTPIEPGLIYHIYNRGNNYQDVFFRDEDYMLFLEKIKLYLIDYSSIFAFALLPNHYHLLLRTNPGNDGLIFSKQFSKFILSYTNKINFRERRDGNLFLSHFRRIEIKEELYLRRLVYYINYNPVKHNLTADPVAYQFSSYHILISDRPTVLNRQEVLSWFGGLNEFLDFHAYLQDEGLLIQLRLEEGQD
jgi:REP element-mobilizing transposase RayT